jgi:hypothetical protein
VLDVKVQKTNKYDHIESKLAGKVGTTVKDIEFMSNREYKQATNRLLKRRENCFAASNPPRCGSSSISRRRLNQFTTGTNLRRMQGV